MWWRWDGGGTAVERRSYDGAAPLDGGEREQDEIEREGEREARLVRVRVGVRVRVRVRARSPPGWG